METKCTKNVSLLKMFPYICDMENKFECILQKAMQLFQKFGIKSITMDDVAQENSMSKKTLYQFISNKTDLVKSVIDFEFSKRRAQFTELKERKLNAIEENIELMKLITKMLKEHNPGVEFDLLKYYSDLYKEASKNRMKNTYNMVFENIKNGKQQGLYRQEINEDLIAKLHVISDFSRVDNEIVSFKDFTSEAAVKEMFTYHLHAMCNEEGLKILKNKLEEL